SRGAQAVDRMLECGRRSVSPTDAGVLRSPYFIKYLPPSASWACHATGERRQPLRTLEELSFDNSYARLPEVCYAKLNPTPFAVPPYLVSFNPAAAELIDLDPAQAQRPEFAGVFGGSLLVPGMDPLAMLYSGHQF